MEDRILKFISDRKGKATKNDVVRYMSEQLSRVPVLNLMFQFESERKIIINKGKRRGQPHYLIINDQNHYNRIRQQLEGIESIMVEMEEPVKQMCDYSMNDPEEDPNTGIRPYPDRADHIDSFLLSCERPIKEMLELLLILTNTLIQSDKDSGLLNRRIVESMLKLGQLFYSQNKLENWQRNINSDIYQLDNNMKHNDFIHEFAKVCLLDLAFSNKLIKRIQKFKSEFLDNASFLFTG